MLRNGGVDRLLVVDTVSDEAIDGLIDLGQKHRHLWGVWLMAFRVPTVTCQVLFVFIMLAHERRRIVHVNITAHPTAQWTAQQIVEAFPWETAPRYLLRDRDSIYGTAF
jgi:putative transposase